MNDTSFLMYAVFFAAWVFSAVALSVFITFLFLNKNNNYGDFAPKIDEYSSFGIHYTREVDNVTSQEKRFLFLEYGEDPYADRKHRYPDQLMEKKKNVTEDEFWN